MRRKRTKRPRTPWRAPGDRRLDDDGLTLVEVVISLALMGIVVTGTLAAVGTSVRTSADAFDGAEIETVLLNASDRIARAPQLCDYEVYGDAAALSQGLDVSAVSSTVERLVANTGNPASDWGPQPCPADVGPFDVQRIVITATTPGGITRSMTVVKSSVD